MKSLRIKDVVYINYIHTRKDDFYLFFLPEFLFRIIPNAASRKQARPKKKIKILGIN